MFHSKFFLANLVEGGERRSQGTSFLAVDKLIGNAFVPYIIFAELALRNVIAIN